MAEQEETIGYSNRKLSQTQEVELIRDYKNKWTVQELSIAYRVSERTIYRLLNQYNVTERHWVIRKTRKKVNPKPVEKPEPTPRELQPCGTNAGYQRHRRNGQYPCTKCLEAHARDVMQAKKKGKKK